MRLSLVVFSLTSILCSLAALAQPRPFTPATRTEILALMAEPEMPRFHLTGAAPNLQHVRFINHFLLEVVPRLAESESLYHQIVGLEALLRAGAFHNETQRNHLNRQLLAAQKRQAEQASDTAVTEAYHEWARRAEGLKGPLPEIARVLAEQRVLEELPAEVKDDAAEAARLSTEFQNAINAAPSASEYGPSMGQLMGTIAEFKARKIDFKTASSRLRELAADNPEARMVAEALEATGDGLTQMAKARTRQAKAKGFRSWAEYKIKKADHGFAPALQGLERKRDLLIALAKQLVPQVKTLREAAIRHFGVDLKDIDLRLEDVSLLTLPDNRALDPYFPKTELRRIYLETLRESGFSDALLRQAVLDDVDEDPLRPQRNVTTAIMNELRRSRPHEVANNLRTLAFEPPANDLTHWRPAYLFIQQTYNFTATYDLNYAFHEFGHAADVLEQRLPVRFAQPSYAQAEVPSTLMESFVLDPEWLWEKMIPVDGYKPSLDEVRTLVRNTWVNKLRYMEHQVSCALMDIFLWDYDYTQAGARTFVEQFAYAFEETARLLDWPPTSPRRYPAFYRFLSTPHFVGGFVEYYGYVFAEIAAHQALVSVRNELQKRTGQNSWLQQPELASILIEKVYRPGVRLAFPESIESFTGQPFDAESWTDQCARLLD